MTESDETQPLSRSWAVPPHVPGTDDGPGRPLACIATTYTFSAGFLETELLPRFLGLAFDPAEREPAFLVEREDALERVTVAVLVDQRGVDVRQTTLRWDQIPIRVPRGIQHAKLTLLMWERFIRLIVGSANLTIPGYRRNREVVGVLDFFDDPESTPRQVLDDALEFLIQVAAFAAADAPVLDRLRGGIAAASARVRRWDRLSMDFTPREYPKVYLVPTLPRANGSVAKSTLLRTKQLWGSRPARDVRVVTPFVGNPDAAFGHLTAELAAVPHLKSAGVHLAVPGTKSEADPRGRVVALPDKFRAAWGEAWGLQPGGLAVYVVTPEAAHHGRPVERRLHAKALFIGDDDLSLLCCGSSNFSASGMGVGVANIEANLCYLDRTESEVDGRGLCDRLPVD
jgi:hypothetical protein